MSAVQSHYSARCEVRGIKSNPTCGVAEQGADGPARRSSSVSRTWWTGPPPSSFTAGCRGPLQDGQAAKAKPLTRSCLRFWTRAWGQRELADEQTGRWISPAWIAGLFQGGLDIPANHVQFQLTPQGTPELDVGRVVACHALGEGELLCLPIVVSFFKRRPSWFIGWLNKALAPVPSRSGLVGRYLKPQFRARHECSGFLTASDHV